MISFRRYINASLAGQIDEAVGAFRWMAPQRLRFSKPDNYSDVDTLLFTHKEENPDANVS